MLCRFNAHCLKFYSVAEHSVHVSYEIAPDLAMLGLMHDAAEAYLGDVPSPLKGELHEFRAIEDKLTRTIADKFGFEHPEKGTPEYALLKTADTQLLVDEQAAIMAVQPEPWPRGDVHPARIVHSCHISAHCVTAGGCPRRAHEV
jgi:hypothetical protein